jgi:hypothetical protein
MKTAKNTLKAEYEFERAFTYYVLYDERHIIYKIL